MSREFRTGVVQFVAADDRSSNLATAERHVRAAAEQGAELVVLPEFFSIPFVPAEMGLDYFDRAERFDGPTVTAMRDLSAELQCAVVCSFFERSDHVGIHHNSVVVLDHGEPVHHYRKSHVPLSEGFREKFYFRPGTEPPRVVQLRSGIRLGVIICYERHFPELSRLLALDGAEVVAIPNASASVASQAGFDLELRAKAYGDQLYVAVANRTGPESVNTYFGCSAVFGPDGSTVVQAEDGFEGALVARCDREVIHRQRVTTPLRRDRRPELYRRLSEPDPALSDQSGR